MNYVCRLLTVVGSQDGPQQMRDVDNRRPATTSPLYARFWKKISKTTVYFDYVFYIIPSAI